MTRLYNPDIQKVVDATGREVLSLRTTGWVVVGERPEDEYLGKTRDQLGLTEDGSMPTIDPTDTLHPDHPDNQ